MLHRPLLRRLPHGRRQEFLLRTRRALRLCEGGHVGGGLVGLGWTRGGGWATSPASYAMRVLRDHPLMPHWHGGLQEFTRFEDLDMIEVPMTGLLILLDVVPCLDRQVPG